MHQSIKNASDSIDIYISFQEKMKNKGFNGLLSDQNIDLNDRWELFKKMSQAKLLPKESYGDGYLDWLGKNFTMYDDFYIDRGVTLSFIDMEEKILDFEDGRVSEAKLNAWKEKVLEKGYGSFIHDW